MTIKHTPITSGIRCGYDENSDKYVIYEEGDNFPWCYTFIASFCREVDAIEWYKRVSEYDKLKAKADMFDEMLDILASIENDNNVMPELFYKKIQDTVCKAKEIANEAQE